MYEKSDCERVFEKKEKKTNVLQLSKQLLPAEMRIQIKPKLAQNCRDAIWK